MLRALCERFAIRQADISIVIVDDKTIKKVNKEFLGRTSVTDVISFDLSDDKKDRVFELVINAQHAERQAKKQAHNPEAELALYVVHGFLHDVGYDDAKTADARRMHKMEDEILEEFGYGITFRTKYRQGEFENVDNTGIWLLIIGGLCLVSMFFSTGSSALHSFSRVKLQEIFRSRGKEELADKLVQDAERLGVSCAFYRLGTFSCFS